MEINHDIHIHTRLSSCSRDPEAVPANYIARAAEKGLKAIGFADHLWDSAVPGASKWYVPQDFTHLLQIRPMIPEDTKGVKVLVGCESEYYGNGKVGITQAVAEQLDFVLLPFTHFHMKNYVIPAHVTETTSIARLMVKRCHEVLALGLATGLAHPFLPLGFVDRTDAIIAAISDTEFTDCFGKAAAAGVSIELHPGFFPEIAGRNLPGFHDETFARVLAIAQQCGCRFHFGSDAHHLDRFSTGISILQKGLAKLGVTDPELVQLAG